MPRPEVGWNLIRKSGYDPKNGRDDQGAGGENPTWSQGLKTGQMPAKSISEDHAFMHPSRRGPFFDEPVYLGFRLYNLRLEILDRIVVRAVNGKNRRKPGYVEHFSDWTLKRTEQDLAVRAIESLGRKEKHA